MEAVVYNGPNEVAVEEIDEPEIEHPNDVVINITTTAICGSDLHIYEGRTGADPGIVFGHENMGIVEQVGDGVSTLTEGDRIVLPFNVACGFCENCEDGYTAFCKNVNPGFHGGAYGYVAMGPYKGGQAEKLRVPYADFNALKLPEGREHEDSFALLADVFPTGWHGTELVNLQPGESIAVFGAGPVGLMAAYSAKIKGAAEIYVVDRIEGQLDLAEKHCDAITVNFENHDPVKQIKRRHGGGVDKGIDAVGYQPPKQEAGGESIHNRAKIDPETINENIEYFGKLHAVWAYNDTLSEIDHLRPKSVQYNDSPEADLRQLRNSLESGELPKQTIKELANKTSQHITELFNRNSGENIEISHEPFTNELEQMMTAENPINHDRNHSYNPAQENPAVVLNNLIRTVRAAGKLGIVGLYVPEDPGAPSDSAAEGRLGIDFGKLFEKGQHLGAGQCNVKRYNRRLRDMIVEGRADPSFLVSHRLNLKEAPKIYEEFDNHEKGITKVLLEP